LTTPTRPPPNWRRSVRRGVNVPLLPWRPLRLATRRPPPLLGNDPHACSEAPPGASQHGLSIRKGSPCPLGPVKLLRSVATTTNLLG